MKDLSFVRAEKKDKQVRQGIKKRKYGTHEMGNLEQPALTEIWKHIHSHMNKAQNSSLRVGSLGPLEPL